MTLTPKEKHFRTLLLNAMTAVVVDANKDSRAETLAQLVEIYETTGNKSVSVFGPDGDKVGAITLNESSPETVINDEAALVEWCKEHRPELLETIEHSPVEAWTETRVRPSALAHIVQDYRLADSIYVTAEGEPVDGVEYRKAPPPSKFTVSYAAKDKGLSLVKAWREGLIPHELTPQLPQLGGDQ